MCLSGLSSIFYMALFLFCSQLLFGLMFHSYQIVCVSLELLFICCERIDNIQSCGVYVVSFHFVLHCCHASAKRLARCVAICHISQDYFWLVVNRFMLSVGTLFSQRILSYASEMSVISF